MALLALGLEFQCKLVPLFIYWKSVLRWLLQPTLKFINLELSTKAKKFGDLGDKTQDKRNKSFSVR